MPVYGHAKAWAGTKVRLDESKSRLSCTMNLLSSKG